MIASNPGLLERDLIKQQRMADGFSSALDQRGVDPDIAGLAARVGIDVFRTAYRQWLEAEDNADLATMTETVMSLLATIVAASASTTLGKATEARRIGRTQFGRGGVGRRPHGSPDQRRPISRHGRRQKCARRRARTSQ
jgi:hypothetical protein